MIDRLLSAPLSPLEVSPEPETTRQRILRVGMACFAQEGFAGATTRMIASAAGVTLPVIAYHFGNKDGLHLACAEEIVEQHRRRLLPVAAAARCAADDGSLTADQARIWLEKILATLVAAITADDEQRLATDFVLRELSEQGPGYHLLYEELWKPGMELVAELIAIARGRSATVEGDRVGAMMLLASLSSLTRDEPVASAFLGGSASEEPHRTLIGECARRMLSGLIAA
ncbi:TetR/AcrR family transcriptional regulator [Novosphingobium huizhouense]|uniref:TetR/AcrR family transcriptional regulator n=1 Tax=Novosphingobium huizhouense TaxID=2866625 RepID=UPI001CD900F9|nr:TetR family transcriptional regulator [Novosphingobium huizhouense]